MKDSSILTRWTLLMVVAMVATLLASASAVAGPEQAISAIGGSDLSLTTGAGLKIPLSQSFSLDLNLSSIATSPSSMGERGWGFPPIPLSKPPGSDLQYTRLGIGLSFKF